MPTSGGPTHHNGDRRPLTIARQAANDTETLHAALDAGVDLVEADVHLYKGVAEVRHSKTLGSRLLWEPGDLIHRKGTRVLTLADVLTSFDGDHDRLILDLRGLRPHLGPVVADTLRKHAPGAAVTVSTPHWWMLKAFADQPWIQTVLSVGSWPMVERLRELLRKGQSSWPNQRPILGCSVHRTLLTPAIVAELRRNVQHVFTWPVDDQTDLAEALRLGVTGVTSKDLTLLDTLHSNH